MIICNIFIVYLCDCCCFVEIKCMVIYLGICVVLVIFVYKCFYYGDILIMLFNLVCLYFIFLLCNLCEDYIFVL